MNPKFLSYKTLNTDYVDVHGRNLNVIRNLDGSILIPLEEVQKTGFHIFPKASFKTAIISNDDLLKEFKLFMLGAAREFMLENSVSLNHKDILDTIELCRRELFKKSATPSSSVGDSSEKESRLQKNFTSNWSADSSSNDNERSKNQNNEDRKNYQKGQIDDSGNRNKRHQHKKNLLNREGNNDKLTTTKENNSKFDGTKKEFKKLSDCMVNRVRLKKTEQLVKIVYIESNNDKEKYWVNLVDNQEIMLNIMESCSKHADVAPLVTEPILGKMYMAMSIEDDLWYRVVVQKIKPFIQVHYIDFGNDAIVSQVRQLPDFLRILPAQAVRITLSRLEGESPPMLKMDGIVSVKFVKWFADGTCVVKTTPSKGSSNDSTNFHKQSTKSVANLEPIFTDRIKYTTELMDKEQIKIIAHSEGRFYLRNKEHHCKLMDINNLIEGFPRKPVKNVEVGQVVLCMKEGEKQLCRAVVRTLDNGLVAVQFIDFQTLEVVSLENVYGISRKLANLPVALIESPIIKGYDANKFGPESESLIEKMVCQKSKLDVAKENGEFDLLLDDKSFSEMLFPSSNLKNTKEQTVGVTNVVKPDSMKEKALGNTLTSISSKDVDATIPIIKSTANKESATSISHLINFTKGKCFRGRVLTKLDNGKYNVGILEYEDQTKDNENIPGNESMIIECDLVFPDTEGVHKRLVELLKPNYIYEMNVLESENHKCALDIPDVRDSLMKEGLI